MSTEFNLGDIKALLAKSQELIDRVDNHGQAYQQPERVFKYVDFLVDFDFSYKLHELNHDYPDSPTIIDPETTVIHGHNSWEPCSTPHFCHIAKFRPGPQHSPAFAKAFYAKWKEYKKDAKLV